MSTIRSVGSIPMHFRFPLPSGTTVKRQSQFLDVVDCETARARFESALDLRPIGTEQVALPDALERVLAEDVTAPVDVPAFDRSNFDGFAVRAEDVVGADEESPRLLTLLEETATAGAVPRREVRPGMAMPIATGGVVPRGADAVVMVEDTTIRDGQLAVGRPVPAGFGLTFAGTDIAQGERVLFQGTQLSSRETAVLAALGLDSVPVVRRPRIAVVSTGDEIVAPGNPLQIGQVFDSNQRVIADALREAGAEPVGLGIAPDDAPALRALIERGLQQCDGVLLSGGTSKGAGDISYRVVEELGEICAHGVAIKPGKPICLAVADGKPLVVLPGFPTSAIFTFHEFVAPVVRRMAGLAPRPRHTRITARLAVGVRSQMGRREYVLASLVRSRLADSERAWVAYPLGKGSGSVTTFSHADGYLTIDQRCELVSAGEEVSVKLLASELKLADLCVIGSHCIGMDWLLSQLNRAGFVVRSLAVGSTAGLEAVRTGRADVAGIHLLDPETGRYNTPFLSDELEVIGGYERRQGIIFRPEDSRLANLSLAEIREVVRGDAALRMVNRNAGSGTRVLIDLLLGDVRPPGYAQQPRTHHAVAASVTQGRADWGVAVEWVARRRGLGFCPLREERYELIARRDSTDRVALNRLRELLAADETRQALERYGLRMLDRSMGRPNEAQ